MNCKSLNLNFAAQIGGTNSRLASLLEGKQEDIFEVPTDGQSVHKIFDKVAEVIKSIDSQDIVVKLYASLAGEQLSDETFRLANVDVDNVALRGEPINLVALLYSKLEAQIIDTTKIKIVTIFDNDTGMNLRAAVKEFKTELESADEVAHVIAGTGFNIGLARVSDIDNELIQGFINTEAGHEPIPKTEDFVFVEGQERLNRISAISNKAANAEIYVAGGRDDDPVTGPKATLSNIIKALKVRSAEEAKILELLKIKYNDFESSVLNQEKDVFSNRELFEAAQAGDILAVSISDFIAMRLATHITSTLDRFSSNNPKLISLSGSIAGAIFKVPSSKCILESFVREKFSAELALKLIEPEMDGTLDLAKCV